MKKKMEKKKEKKEVGGWEAIIHTQDTHTKFHRRRCGCKNA